MDTIPNENIEQNVSNVVDISDVVSDDKKEKKIYHTFDTMVSAIHIRVYAEMFGAPDGTGNEDALEVLHLHLSRVKNIPRSRYFVDAGIHDMDTKKDDVENPSSLKVHGHICLMVEGRKANGSGKLKQMRMGTIMKDLEKLLGLRMRLEYPALVEQQKKDKNGNWVTVKRAGKPSDAPDFGEWNAIKRLRLGASTAPDSLSAMVAYLDHDTVDARNDGKYQYLPIGENPYRYSNDVEFSKTLIDRYHRTQDFQRNDKCNIVMSKPEWKMWLKDEAYKLGQNGGNDLAWYKSLPPVAQCGDYDKLIQKWYALGSDEYLQSDVGINNTRCCIFINGIKDLGKTYNSTLALKHLGYKTLEIDGGHTGKYDNLTSDTEALVVSDTGLMDYFAVMDDKYCRLYRRNNSNPLWCGKYLIITFNGDFNKYMETFASSLWDDETTTKDRKDALRSRLYHCRCTENGLSLVEKASRGDGKKQDERDALFLAFYDAFQEHQKAYMDRKRMQSLEKGENTKRVDALLNRGHMDEFIPCPDEDNPFLN